MHTINKLARTAMKNFRSKDEEKLEKKQVKNKLVDVVKESKEILCSAKTVFPFTPFPSKITVDRENITIADRNFLSSGEIISVRMEDVLNVSANVGPFFGTLKIHTKFFDPGKPYKLSYLWRNEALRLMHIIDGYIIAQEKGVNCDVLNTKELETLLSKLGGGAKADI